MDISGQKWGILGLARSGLATVEALKNAQYFAWDDNEKGRKAALNHNYHLCPIDEWPWDTLDYMVISPGIPHTWPKPHKAAELAKQHHIPLISDVEILSYLYPQNPILAITGTNGKSTTTSLIQHIFEYCKAPSLMGGNIGKAVLGLKPSHNEPFILELSSYQLEITPSLKPKIAALINITADHLERHGGMENYIKAKALIFKNQTADDFAIIGIDEPETLHIYENFHEKYAAQLIAVSVLKAVSGGIYVQQGWLIDDRNHKQEKIFELKKASFLAGQHNHQNIAIAYAIATSAIQGQPLLDKNKVIEAIIHYKGLRHRQQFVKKWKNISFINDSKATNGNAASKALSAYSNILWLAGGLAKEDGLGESLHFLANIEKAFIYGQDRQKLFEALPLSLKAEKYEQLKEALTHAIDYALSHKDKEFILLLSPAAASFDAFNDFEERGDYFMDLIETYVKS